MTLEVSGTLMVGTKLNIYALFSVEKRHMILKLYVHILQKMITAHMNQILLGLGTSCFPMNNLSKKKHVMHHGVSESQDLKVSSV